MKRAKQTGRGRMLVVDDEATIREVLKRHFSGLGFECSEAQDASSALQEIRKRPPEVVLLDIRLPDVSGKDIIEEILSFHPETTILMLTALDDTTLALDCFRKGAFGYILKPFNLNALTIDVENALYRRTLEMENLRYESALERTVQGRTKELAQSLRRVQESYELTIRTLASVLDRRYAESEAHCGRLARATTMLARTLGIEREEIAHIERGAYLHDIGKIVIPDSILEKKGMLDEKEWELVRKHPQIGYEILREIPYLVSAAEIVRSHHERYDGTGYPMHLKGEETPLGARIISLCDSLDAMLTTRPYRETVSFNIATEDIVAASGLQFDPDIVKVFVKVHEKLRSAVYPAAK